MGLKKNIKIILPVLALLWGSEAIAVGMGMTSGTADEEWSNGGFSTVDHEVSNFGFVLDTAVARKNLFNYRFSLMTEESEYGGSQTLEGISMTHDFGFALFQNRAVRLWLGPRINTAIYDTVNGVTLSEDLLVVSFGPVLGINAHLGSVVSLSATAGILSGEADTVCTGFCSSASSDVDSSFINLSIIFRINDNY